MAQFQDPTALPEFTVSPAAVLRGKMGVQETEPGMGGPEALGSYGEVGGQLTGMPGGSQLGVDWTPDTPEEMQRKMEEREIYDAKIRLEMLAKEILNSRKNLIDEIFGGDDPALRNTKPITDKLTTMEVKTLKDALPEPTEMTPKEKLEAATLEINIGRDARARVEGEKQKDMEHLANAVTNYNEQITGLMTSVRGEAAALQEKHATLDKVAAGVDQAMMEAQADVEQALIKATGDVKEPQEPTRADIQAIHKVEEELATIKDQESAAFKNKLKVVNGMRTAVGLPALTKTIIQKGKKRTFFGNWGIFWDVKEKAKYTGSYSPQEDPLGIL